MFSFVEWTEQSKAMGVSPMKEKKKRHWQESSVRKKIK